jgi:hypothetical protein
MAWLRVRANRGSRSAGVDGKTAYHIEQVLGVREFLARLREELRSGEFQPLPVKERLIPKHDGKKVRRLGVPALRDRVVQAALKLVLEPIFEADFQPCSYGFRPGRRARDAIAEIHYYSQPVPTSGLSRRTSRRASMSSRTRPFWTGWRQRLADKRVLALIKAFLKAGIMSEQGRLTGTVTGTPQGGIVAAHLAVGHIQPPEQTEVLGRSPVLRHVQQVQTGPVGVRRPPERRLHAQVLLDQDPPTPDRHGYGVTRRPRPSRLLGQPTAQGDPADQQDHPTADRSPGWSLLDLRRHADR